VALALGFSGGAETTILPPETIPLGAAIIIEDEESSKQTAEGPQPPGLSIFTDGSRTDSGAVGYVGTWKRGLQWRRPSFTWTSNKMPTMPSARPLPMHWNPLPSGLLPMNASPSSQTPKQRFEGWRQMSPAPIRSTPSRQGSTSQLSGVGGEGLRSSSVGVLLTVGCREMIEHLRPGRRSSPLLDAVAPLQGADAGASLQVLPALERSAENPVGGGAKGHKER